MRAIINRNIISIYGSSFLKKVSIIKLKFLV